MASADIPYKPRGGDSYQTAMHNRISALDRVKFLSGIDLKTKSKYYLYALDVWLWEKWYRTYPKDHKIDEEWCQRAAEIVKLLEEDSVKFNKPNELSAKIASAYEGFSKEEPIKQEDKWSLRNIFKKGERNGKSEHK